MLTVPLLQCSQVQFSWPGRSQSIIEIDEWSIAQGEKVFLHGPSGSGKSTFLNLIAGVLTPRRGGIRILGEDLGALSAHRRDQFRGDHLGFVFQTFNLIPYLSAIENVVLPLHFSLRKRQRVQSKGVSGHDEAVRLLKELQIPENVLRTRHVSEFSIGQQQRVAAARALMGDPEFIIADEPTSALDAGVREHFLHLLFKESQRIGAALLFVSHDLSLGRHFDRQVELGRINKVRATHLEER